MRALIGGCLACVLVSVTPASMSAATGATAKSAALFAHGLRLRNGIGVRTDAQRAFDLIMQAARDGHPAAMFTLSNMLAHGEGAMQDIGAAQVWLQAAADVDYPEALQQLALQEPDPVKSAQLMRSAAHALRHRAHGH